jgi:LEA14-like dessication related protein
MTALRRPLRGLLAVALLAALPGCAFLSGVLGSAFERPKLHYKSWSTESLDLEGVTIALHYALENPNPMGLSLARLGYAIEVEQRPLASGDLPAGLTIPAGGEAALDIPVRLRWADVPNFVQKLFTQTTLPYRVSGSAGVKTPLGVVDLPFSHSDQVTLPRPPSFAIDSAKVGSASLGDLSLDVKLRISNPNGFPLPVGMLTYGVQLGQDKVADGSSRIPTAVPPKGTAVINLPVRVSLAGAGRALYRSLRGGEVPVEVVGKAGLGGLEFPFRDQEPVQSR